MTRKRRLLLWHLAHGKTPAEAAEAAGYGMAYTTRLLGDPAFQKSLEEMSRRQKPTSEPGGDGSSAADPVEQLRRILEDPGSDPGQVIQAAKALMAYQEKHTGPEPKTPIIIDDIPRIEIAGEECRACPVYLARMKEGFDGAGGADQGREGLPQDEQPGKEPGAGFGNPAPATGGGDGAEGNP